MRKIFGAATGLALIGATLFGAVYAWSASGSDNDSATVGTVAVTVAVAPNSNVLGPNDNSLVTVGTVTVTNTGSLAATSYSGTVTIDSVTAGAPGGGGCSTTDFTPAAIGVTPIANPANVQIATNNAAPEDCQGDSVAYTVNITATT